MSRVMGECARCGAVKRYGQEVYNNDHPFFKGLFFCDRECFKNYAKTYSEELIEAIDEDSYREAFCDEEDV